MPLFVSKNSIWLAAFFLNKKSDFSGNKGEGAFVVKYEGRSEYFR